MNNFLNFYNHLPEHISPAAFHIGSFSIGWYPLMYIIAFLTVYLLLRWRINNKEFSIFNFKFFSPSRDPARAVAIKSQTPNNKLQNILEEFIFYSFLGVIIGGRLGYVLFYNLPYYWNNPMAIVSPFDAAGKFIGIYGMSYHGGLIGVVLATWFFCKKNKIEFLKWADFAAPAVPAGFFFGRIGNFLNGELFGRITTKSWGMYFPAGGEILRHPSQIYEAFFEGLILFVILWSVRNGLKNKTIHFSCFILYILLYGFFRFFLEFFRAPDAQLGFIFRWGQNGLTMGQVLSFFMVIISSLLFFYRRKKKIYNS
jgi:phosphatidylglycerol---prolipoprotein diacylglyceryl transferase